MIRVLTKALRAAIGVMPTGNNVDIIFRSRIGNELVAYCDNGTLMVLLSIPSVYLEEENISNAVAISGKRMSNALASFGDFVNLRFDKETLILSGDDNNNVVSMNGVAVSSADRAKTDHPEHGVMIDTTTASISDIMSGVGAVAFSANGRPASGVWMGGIPGVGNAVVGLCGRCASYWGQKAGLAEDFGCLLPNYAIPQLNKFLAYVNKGPMAILKGETFTSVVAIGSGSCIRMALPLQASQDNLKSMVIGIHAMLDYGYGDLIRISKDALMSALRGCAVASQDDTASIVVDMESGSVRVDAKSHTGWANHKMQGVVEEGILSNIMTCSFAVSALVGLVSGIEQEYLGVGIGIHKVSGGRHVRLYAEGEFTWEKHILMALVTL